MQSNLSKILVDVNNGLKFAKCPRWVNKKLLFLDIHDRSIKSTDTEGRVHIEESLSYLPGAFGVLASGGLIVGDARRRKLFLFEKNGWVQAADLSGVAKSYLSDAIVDKKGGIYVGDVGFDFLDPLVDPVSTGMIVHIDEGGRASLVAEDLFFPNGMVVTPDESTLIVAETLGHRLTAFDIAADGTLVNRRIWAQLSNEVKPDGICLDSQGAIWAAASIPRALRVLEGGQIVAEFFAEQAVFGVMLGGPQCKHLFMCTSSSCDPIITRRTPSATIEIALVNVAGVSPNA